MSANSLPNRVPKGVPTGGEFAEGTRGEMSSANLGGFFTAADTDFDDFATETDVREAPAPEPVSGPGADEALEQFGLSEDQLPGIRKAWQKRFDRADDPLPQSVKSATLDSLELDTVGRDRGTSIEHNGDGSLDIEVSTRNGGGNRDCFCDNDPETIGDHEDGCLAAVNERMQASRYYVDDSDDEFDSTYADFRFHVPAGDDARRITDAEGNADDYHAIVTQRAERDEILSGRKPVWSLLSDGRLPGRISSKPEWQVKHEGEQLNRRETELRFLTAALDGDDIADRDKYRRIDVSGNVTMTVNDVARAGQQHRSAQREWDRIAPAMEEARNLPEGDLKDFLIGERAEQSYPVSVGRGRNKRTVMKTYTPKSELTRSYESAEKSVEDSTAQYEKVKKIINDGKTELAEQRKAHQFNVTAAKADLKTAWAAGWPGMLKDVPEPHPDFRPPPPEQWPYSKF